MIFSLQDKAEGGAAATIDLTGLFTEFSILSLEVSLDLVKIQYILIFNILILIKSQALPQKIIV